MRSDLPKPVLLAWLDGLPEVESLYPLLAVLNERDRIELRVLVSRTVVRREPRLRHVFADSSLRPVVAGSLRMKHLTAGDIGAADALIGLSDPARDLSTKRKRSSRVAAARLPSAFLQHGALQSGVNIPLPNSMPDYASGLLMLWNPGDGEAEVLPQQTRSLQTRVGFTKAPIFANRPLSAQAGTWLDSYPKRLLICHSFRWGGRYDESDIAAFYEMLDRFLREQGDCGVILRSHRGKRRSSHAGFDRALQSQHRNILISEQRAGPLRGNSILDDLALVQAMVSPESTTVLDAIYAGRQVAIWDKTPRLFKDLPRIQNVGDLVGFAADPSRSAPQCNAIRAAYGEFPENLDRAAEAVEAFVLQAARQPC